MARITGSAGLAGIVALGAAGCAPNVQLGIAPEIFSAEWQAAPGARPDAPLPPNLGAAFGSAELERLIVHARAANPDIGAAAARIIQARGQLRAARAAMLPVATASAGLGASVNQGEGARGLFDFGQTSAGLDISYEADLFGSARAGRRSAAARVAAASWDRDAAALAAEAEVARAYVQYAALADRMVLLDRNLDHARELERIIGIRFRAGAGTRLDVGLQAIQIRQIEAERLRLAGAQIQTRNALAVLLGAEAPLFVLTPARLAGLAVPRLAPVQPAELLVRRPDIRAAEARIAAASGDVERARAAFLPRLTLSARGLGQVAGLTGPVGATLALGSDLIAPIFNRGRLRGDLLTAGGVQMEAVELYRGALLAALGETENALTAVEQSRARQMLLETIVGEAREAARLARLQYIEGEADLQWVINAEQILVQAEDAGALAAQERLEAAIDLFRALGGPARG